MAKAAKLDKRSLEVKASQWNLAKTKTIAATIFHVLKDSPEQAIRVWKALRKLHKVVKSNALYNSEWIYADYIFNWDNVDYSALDKRVKKLQEDELKKSEWERKKYSHAIALTDPVLMQKLLDHGVNFDANLSAQKKLREFANILCPNWIQFIDMQSQQNLAAWIEMSERLWKKLIVLPNHVSHMDAVVIDSFFKWLRNNSIIPKHKKIRLVEWVYMALTPWVRQFSIWFNTTKVIWEWDMSMFLANAKKNNDPVNIEYINDEDEIIKITSTPMQQIKTLKKQATTAYFANKENEISIIFPYAGRWENGWVKSEISIHMKQFLMSPDCVYVALNIHDTDQLKPTKSDFFIGAHTWFQPYDIKVHVSEPWIGWDKNLEQMHELMLEQRDSMRPQFDKIEKKKAHEKFIIELQSQISDIINFWEEWWELTDEEVENYQQLKDVYINARDREI